MSAPNFGLKDKELELFSRISKENDSLKAQLKTAKLLQSTLLDGLTIEKVIKVKYRLGLGTRKDPVRIITSYWDIDGNHLFNLEEP